MINDVFGYVPSWAGESCDPRTDTGTDEAIFESVCFGLS